MPTDGAGQDAAAHIDRFAQALADDPTVSTFDSDDVHSVRASVGGGVKCQLLFIACRIAGGTKAECELQKQDCSRGN
jgi:hypothetical protein